MSAEPPSGDTGLHHALSEAGDPLPVLPSEYGPEGAQVDLLIGLAEVESVLVLLPVLPFAEYAEGVVVVLDCRLAVAQELVVSALFGLEQSQELVVFYHFCPVSLEQGLVVPNGPPVFLQKRVSVPQVPNPVQQIQMALVTDDRGIVDALL